MIEIWTCGPPWVCSSPWTSLPECRPRLISTAAAAALDQYQEFKIFHYQLFFLRTVATDSQIWRTIPVSVESKSFTHPHVRKRFSVREHAHCSSAGPKVQKGNRSYTAIRFSCQSILQENRCNWNFKGQFHFRRMRFSLKALVPIGRMRDPTMRRSDCSFTDWRTS